MKEVDFEEVTRSPLCWPPGVRRASRRKDSRFRLTGAKVIEGLRAEAKQHGDRGAFIISTNLELRNDGLPRANQRVDDPGAAVYFCRKGRTFVLACDSYFTAYENMRALTKTLEGLRTIERHGASDLLERAYSGFLALSPPIVAERPWWEILGVESSASFAAAKRAYRALAIARVPELERSGDIFTAEGHAELVDLNNAMARAAKDRD